MLPVVQGKFVPCLSSAGQEKRGKCLPPSSPFQQSPRGAGIPGNREKVLHRAASPTGPSPAGLGRTLAQTFPGGAVPGEAFQASRGWEEGGIAEPGPSRAAEPARGLERHRCGHLAASCPGDRLDRLGRRGLGRIPGGAGLPNRAEGQRFPCRRPCVCWRPSGCWVRGRCSHRPVLPSAGKAGVWLDPLDN